VLAGALATTASWRAAGGRHITPTRAQLALLREQNPRLRPLGEQLVPMRFLGAADVPGRLAITTSPFDAQPPDTLLYLEEVPAGPYRLRTRLKPFARGELVLAIGRASLPAARWPVEAERGQRFYLPVRAAFVRVLGDAEAVRSVEEVALIPDSRGESNTGQIGRPANTPVSGAARARDAARYGSVVVYTTDDRVWLEPRGFWVMGGRKPEVVIAVDEPAGSIDVDVRNGPGMNRVKLRTGGWSTERELGPDEPWRVRVPIAGDAQAIPVTFEVERGFVPADLDQRSSDRRSLGCWIEVH
jgi:hypothetical protein